MKKLLYVTLLACLVCSVPHVSKAFAFTEKGKTRDAIHAAEKKLHKYFLSATKELSKVRHTLEHHNMNEQEIKKLSRLRHKTMRLNREIGSVMHHLLESVGQ